MGSCITFRFRSKDLFWRMSGTAGTIRGTTSGRNTGRGKLPDFDNSYIPRPKSESPSTHNHHNNHHTAGSDVGSTTMSTTTRQRQNQSKRDEVAYSSVLSVFACSLTDMFSRGGKSNCRLFDGSWRRTSARRGIRPRSPIALVGPLRVRCLP